VFSSLIIFYLLISIESSLLKIDDILSHTFQEKGFHQEARAMDGTIITVSIKIVRYFFIFKLYNFNFKNKIDLLDTRTIDN